MAIDYEKDLFECAKCGWTGKHDEKLTKHFHFCCGLGGGANCIRCSNKARSMMIMI